MSGVLVDRWVRKRAPGREVTDGTAHPIHKVLRIQVIRADAQREAWSTGVRLDPSKEATGVTAGAAGLSEHYTASAKTCL